MNNNYTYKLIKCEIQNKIINYLYQNNQITMSEYEQLILKFDEKINKLKKQISKKKNNYIYPIKVNIEI